jgi:hypothetical protein
MDKRLGEPHRRGVKITVPQRHVARTVETTDHRGTRRQCLSEQRIGTVYGAVAISGPPGLDSGGDRCWERVTPVGLLAQDWAAGDRNDPDYYLGDPSPTTYVGGGPSFAKKLWRYKNRS